MRGIPEAVANAGESETLRIRVTVEGAVQGIGFRPKIHRLASGFGLRGWVCNSRRGVVVELEGKGSAVERCLGGFWEALPEGTVRVHAQQIAPEENGPVAFEIRPSDATEQGEATPPPDVATCPECVREIFDPHNRRHRYPFTTCARCGPRFTLLEGMPYDRERTVMRKFPLCALCRSEYGSPADRRFHAQAIACPECGPRLEWWDATGRAMASEEEALGRACEALQRGGIVALKGIGGFQLMVSATDSAAVSRLRERKAREAKPFAVMFSDVEAVGRYCQVDALERALLESPEAPIVLLERRREAPAVAVLAAAVAPGNPWVGALLPCSPLHHLLARGLGFPVVATSGNLSGEPLCFRESEVLERLGGIADGFLVHDRPIVRPADDSVVRIVAGRPQVLRRARGFAPLTVELPTAVRDELPEPTLALGTHQKNAMALAVGHRVTISPHLGDMDSVSARSGFEQTVRDLPVLCGVAPTVCVVDRHPDYFPTRFGERWCATEAGRLVLPVSHHAAHVLACMAEHGLTGSLLGIAWDGTGLGPDGTLWGGEFLEVTDTGVRRAAHWREFPLPGGERSIEEPWRSAFGILWDLRRPEAIDALDAERRVMARMLERGIQCPRTPSIGRLFDAVASLSGVCQRSRFEGEAAMALEFACMDLHSDDAYDVAMNGDILDWEPMVRQVLEDVRTGVLPGWIALRFHNALANAVVAVARRLGHARVVLSGGCFQNRRLTELAIRRLRDGGFTPYWHERVPPNDGGVALGQAYASRLGWAGKM